MGCGREKHACRCPTVGRSNQTTGSMGPAQQDPVGHVKDWFYAPKSSGEPLKGFRQIGYSLVFVF